MNDERKLPKQAKNSADEALSSSEDADLKAFCSKVCFEEISFDSWRSGHGCLDLRYPLNIKRHVINESPKHLIKLSRTITSTSKSGRRSESRERFEIEVSFCENVKDSLVFKYPGLGDRCDEECGDLLVIVQISD